jgi:hypothetical protein
MEEATAITKEITAEISWLREEARTKRRQGKTAWSTPISHFVTQESDHIACSDACLVCAMGRVATTATLLTVGGKSAGMNFTRTLDNGSINTSVANSTK